MTLQCSQTYAVYYKSIYDRSAAKQSCSGVARLANEAGDCSEAVKNQSLGQLAAAIDTNSAQESSLRDAAANCRSQLQPVEDVTAFVEEQVT
jgi:hypothetical protein